MKKIILILLVLLLFIYSCEDANQEEIHIYGCEFNEDCISRIGENYICQNNSCEYDYCKSLNGYQNCGEGLCINSVHGYSCSCVNNQYNKGMYLGYSKGYFNIEKCITDISCEEASDCKSLKKDDLSYQVCSSTENQCVTHCQNDFDCKGDYSKCDNYYSSSNRCIDLKELYNEYLNTPEYDEACKDSFFDPYEICGKNCEVNNECSIGFTCSLDKKCLPICVENKDCEDDKFSDGNICSSDLNYCVKE